MRAQGATAVTLDVRGAAVRLLDAGAGPPVLLLHGNPDTAEVWSPVIDRLRHRHRCLAPDLPGFGGSALPRDFEASLDGMARFVAGVVEAAVPVPGPLDLVAHDLGGPFGLAWAVRNPDRVRRIAVINTVFFSDYRWHFWGRVWRTPLLGELAMALLNRPGFEAELRRNSGLSREQIRAIYARITPRMKRAVLRLYRALDPGAFRGWEDELIALTAARAPTLVLWGDRDPYVPARFAERFGAREVHHLADCGHWPQLEDPDRTADRLLAFFR